jgi:hypothetical protein
MTVVVVDDDVPSKRLDPSDQEPVVQGRDHVECDGLLDGGGPVVFVFFFFVVVVLQQIVHDHVVTEGVSVAQEPYARRRRFAGKGPGEAPFEFGHGPSAGRRQFVPDIDDGVAKGGREHECDGIRGHGGGGFLRRGRSIVKFFFFIIVVF